MSNLRSGKIVGNHLKRSTNRWSSISLRTFSSQFNCSQYFLCPRQCRRTHPPTPVGHQWTPHRRLQKFQRPKQQWGPLPPKHRRNPITPLQLIPKWSPTTPRVRPKRLKFKAQKSRPERLAPQQLQNTSRRLRLLCCDSSWNQHEH